ncbi:MAG TPA: ferrochelatase [Burkholderiales bacterium]|nr:ferrochelatase [Burkholderiales bacterium]
MKGVLLVNLGTPSAPTAPAVRAYLAEFLSDPRVVKLPRLLWLPILYGIVLRRRPAQSAQKYAQVWMPEGSPLAVHTARQAGALRAQLPKVQVEYAMRYGEPSIESALRRFADRDITVVPLYPQYAESTTASVADRLPPGLRMVRDFHDHPGYIAALAVGVRRHWQRHGRSPMLVMSFHGLPQRGAEEYERQCHASAERLAAQLALAPGEWKATFQSRFGYARWLQPYTEPTLVALARSGASRVDVICPGFVADCLETLEEIGIAARERFLEAGGREFHALPCLNEAPEWIAALAAIARAS